ncbi:MAG TPA: YIP1 family protein [Vicinamibacteria bacterium]|nr:YIP1 family protein [Vicinamibacteria bacterium]
MSETTPPASGPTPGFFSHLAGLYSSPTEEFKRILPRPRFWVPMLLGMALNLSFTGIWLSKVDALQFMKNTMEESGAADRIPADRMDEILETQAKFMKVGGLAGGLLGVPLVVLLCGAFFLFVYRFFYGSEVTFGQSLSLVAWSFLVPSLVSIPLLLLTYALKGDWNLSPDLVLQANLSLLFDKAVTAKPLFALAKSLDLFNFWIMFLLAAAFGAAAKRSAGAAAMGVVVPWAVWVLGKVVFAAVF